MSIAVSSRRVTKKTMACFDSEQSTIVRLSIVRGMQLHVLTKYVPRYGEDLYDESEQRTIVRAFHRYGEAPPTMSN